MPESIAPIFRTRLTTQPWGREVELTHPDGNGLRVGGPAPARPAE